MTTFHHVVCPGCGCVCDDLTLRLEGAEVSQFAPNCPKGEAWYRQHADDSNQPGSEPPAKVAGQPADLPNALDEAARILNHADYPLIYGLARSATSGQRAAVALGEALGGVVDSTASLCHGPSIMALQEVGEVTSTLGEIRNRADLVVFWGCNPAESHPRHAERYSVHPPGKYLPGGRSDRTIVMVGDADAVHNWQLDAEGSQPDFVIPIPPGKDFEALVALYEILHDRGGHCPNPELQHLMQLMKGCRYGVVFFGLGLAKTSMGDLSQKTDTGHNDVAALLKLVAELNTVTRFTARRMRLQGDVSGADNVLCWQTGYPFGVDFSRGYPRYNPGEFTANELLSRGDIDACLLLGGETIQYFSDPALDHLRSIPTVLIDYPTALSPISPSVRINTAVHGVHAAGTIYRMDNVPLPLRALTTSRLPQDAYVLDEIRRRCG